MDEQAEAFSLVGDLGRDLAGGFLRSATVRPSLRVIVTESAAELRRTHREELGLR